MKTAAQAFGVYFKRLHDKLNELPGTIYRVQKSQTGLTTVTIKRPWFKDYVTITFAGIGNIDALRGRTNDFLIIDEAAFMPASVWWDVLKPTLDDTKGKALITSTQWGRGWFYQLQQLFDKLRRDGHTFCANQDYDNVTSMLRSTKEIEEAEILAKGSGKWAAYLREQKNNPDAVDLEEAPYSMSVLEARSKNQSLTASPQQFPVLNVNVDLGKPGNNAAWMYGVDNNKIVHLLDYQDEFNNYDLIEYVVNTYPEHYINIIYPDDANQPEVVDGKTRYEKILEYLRGHRRIRTQVLPRRTGNKKNFMLRSIEVLQNSRINLLKCREGLDKLAGVRLKKDPKTEYVEFANIIKNGCQHASDALGYVGISLDNYYSMNVAQGIQETKKSGVNPGLFSRKSALSGSKYENLKTNRYKL